MKKQLLYYGPPGTGKTYHIQRNSLQHKELERKEKEREIKIELGKEFFESYYNRNSFLLTEDKFKPGKKTYRNLTSLNKLIKYSIDIGSDTLLKSNIKAHFGWQGPSTYVQHIRVLTNFGLTDGIDKDQQITLNQKGKELKEKYREIIENDIVDSDHSIPDFAVEYLIKELKYTTTPNMYLWKNTIFIGLWLALINGESISINENKTPTDEEVIAFNEVFPDSNDKYIEYTSWATGSLRNLKLVDDNLALTQSAFNLLDELMIFDKDRDNLIGFNPQKMYFLSSKYLYDTYIEQKVFKTFKEEKHIEAVTFHPSLEYEDFIEGITVRTDQNGSLDYYNKDGILKKFCTEALKNCLEQNEVYNLDLDRTEWSYYYQIYQNEADNLDWSLASTFVFIIDELNRGDVPNVFGEIISLIEDDKRIGELNELSVTLPYTQDEFAIPKNIVFLMTMNTSDKSIGSLDMAIRRRFDLFPLDPDFAKVKYSTSTDLNESDDVLSKTILALENLNKILLKLPHIGRSKLIGHAVLLGHKELSKKDIYNIWRHNIAPLIEDYFIDDFLLMMDVLEVDDTIIDKFTGFNFTQESQIDAFVEKLLEHE